MSVVQRRVCAKCGRLTSDGWIEALGRFWHPDHFLCSACGAPVGGDFVVEDGQPVHVACSEARRPVCMGCGAKLNGVTIVDAWGQRYCAAHEGELVPCLGCGGFLSRHARSMPGASILANWCRRCAAIGVSTDAVLKREFSKVLRWAESFGLHGVSSPVEVRFGSEAEFPNACECRSARRAGLTLWVEPARPQRLVPAQVERQVTSVAVLRGAPQPLCQTILAHEAGHVWFCHERLTDVDPVLEEGFCEYVAYRFNGANPTLLGNHYRKQIAENDDPVYGVGFRAVHEYLRHMTLTRFVEGLRAGRIRSA